MCLWRKLNMRGEAGWRWQVTVLSGTNRASPRWRKETRKMRASMWWTATGVSWTSQEWVRVRSVRPERNLRKASNLSNNPAYASREQGWNFSFGVTWFDPWKGHSDNCRSSVQKLLLPQKRWVILSQVRKHSLRRQHWVTSVSMFQYRSGFINFYSSKVKRSKKTKKTIFKNLGRYIKKQITAEPMGLRCCVIAFLPLWLVTGFVNFAHSQGIYPFLGPDMS